MTTDAVLWSFEYFYHMDKANACIHTSPVRFSPITFRLAAMLYDSWTHGEEVTEELAEVLKDAGSYEEDRGR